MSKVYVFVRCQPGCAEDVRRSLRGLARENPSIQILAEKLWNLGRDYYDIVLCLISDDWTLLAEQMSTLKSIDGIDEMAHCIAVR